MPDGATTITPEAPKVTAADALAGGEAPSFTGTLTKEQRTVKEAHDKQERIEAAKAESKTPKDILGKTAEVPEYTQKNLEDTVTALEAGDEIKNAYGPIVQYLEAVKRSKREGITLDQALGTNADSVQTAVGKLLVERGRLYEKFPQLKGLFANEADLHKYIEQNMGRDARFQREIVRELTRIHDEAKNIGTPNPKEKSTANIKEVQDSQIDALKSRLKEEGVDDAAIEMILKTVDTGDINLTLATTVDGLIKAKGIKNASWLDNYTRSQNALAQAQREHAEIVRRLGIEQGKQKGRNNDLIDSLTGQRDTLNNQITEAKNAIDSDKNSYKTTFNVDDAGFSKDLQELRNARAVLSEQNGLNRTINFIHTNGQTLKQAEASLAEEGDGDAAERATKRAEQQAELKKALEGAVDTAMSEFLLQRLRDLESDSSILLDASQKKAEKDGNTWRVGAIEEIKKLSKDIRKYDKKERKFVYSKDKISEKLRQLTQYSADGKDGARQLFAETVGFKTDPEELKLQIAQQVGGPSSTYERLTEQQKLDADSIIAQRTADFESLYAEHGEGFKKTLFESYMANKGFMDKIGHGKLSLTDDEVDILNKQFGGLMESELEKSGLMRALKEKGIVPDSKLKILLALLAILGIGTIAAVGIAPAAIAVGGAAKGIGSAAWSEGIV